jgi:hypothetical protein
MLPHGKEGNPFVQNVKQKKIIVTVFDEVFLLKLFYFGSR